MHYREAPSLQGRDSHGTWCVDLWYPRQEGEPDSVRIDLTDVRAAAGLTVRYDFERDGWVILRDLYRDMDDHMSVIEPNVEVGFLPAYHEEAPCSCYSYPGDDRLCERHH